MLYIRVWLISLKSSFIAKLFILCLLISIVPAIKFTIVQVGLTKIENPFFHVLIPEDEKQGRDIQAKLQNLPGIIDVGWVSKKFLNSKLKKFLLPSSVINSEGSSEKEFELFSSLDFNYSGLKVVISKELREKAQGMLQSYIVKIAGEGTEVGPTQYPEKSSKKYQFINAKIFKIFPMELLIIGSLWMFISLWLFKKDEKFFYLLKVFNRARFTALKIYFCHYVFFIIPVAVTLQLMQGRTAPPQFFMQLIIFLITAFVLGQLAYSRKVSWRK